MTGSSEEPLGTPRAGAAGARMARQGQAGDTGASGLGRGRGWSHPIPSGPWSGSGFPWPVSAAVVTQRAPQLGPSPTVFLFHPSDLSCPSFPQRPLRAPPAPPPAPPSPPQLGHRAPAFLIPMPFRCLTPVGIIHTWSIPTAGDGSCGRNPGGWRGPAPGAVAASPGAAGREEGDSGTADAGTN